MKGGRRLKDARLREGLTQDELGQRSGVSQRLISAMERGYRTGSLSSWQALAQALNVSVTWLTEDEPVSAGESDGVEGILADESSPPGLRDLASDAGMVEALGISAIEWHALRSLDPPGLLSREAYLAVLFAMRSGLRPV
ncbi:MAG: helix-turn-helix domain-containing protein [Chromatiaceae bacterium]|nr:helix-turn-helix domain-containing protein [Chromatiaceae bacterium]MCF7995596.1 helix-turn-helix domain-containing protein [Chromatiaceae bacterium]